VVQCTTDNRLEGSGHSEAQNAALGGDSFISQWRAAGSKAISQLMVAIGPLGDPGQAMRAIDAFNTIWHAGLILFAVRLLLIGYVSVRLRHSLSGYAWNWREPVAEAELRPHESR
jgi:hypothetical protein